ncbi:Pterin-4-alpha-carbinolamine dehydratase [Hondaea fermentalgiana]|uniref:4a-hydroxytetrahydrobiopterin dehydratase n=1 Tax=Hondaea fermentalgiana TaxID=2315210 RepID=A0A2R5GW69_9STRA|nr:Pterin-4-alpha-carbinolamine dehydratase [Hondaea fermentalgiana]|eukprot:GBG32661.1 Pterin-4-alpha-carbinolamine dehydratase [Hondaea fermentalgiana]
MVETSTPGATESAATTTRAASANASEASQSASEQKRRKCSGTPLEEKEVAQGLETLCPSWKVVGGNLSMEKSFVAKNFVKAMAWINAAAEAAEELNHHPDFHLTSYRNVKVVLQTHSAQALTAVDLELAQKLDAIPTEYSPKFLRENPHVRVVSAAVETADEVA